MVAADLCGWRNLFGMQSSFQRTDFDYDSARPSPVRCARLVSLSELVKGKVRMTGTTSQTLGLKPR
jgi:hypothetical protein